MFFIYLDEFGHIGPYFHRRHEKYNESPVFGLAGIILPEPAIRPFATAFLQLKQALFIQEIMAAKVIAQKWEKKGTDIFRPKAIARYQNLRSGGFRLINQISKVGGHIFYHGREKIFCQKDGHSNGLYTTIFAAAIRRLDEFCTLKNENFVLVVDEHSARKELLECAAKTMFGNQPARRLVSPPFQVESYLNQNIQAADWIASIVGKLWAHEILPDQYEDHVQFRQYYWDRLHKIATYSTVIKRKQNNKQLELPHKQPRVEK
ncbi:MAG: DUF3800 domain-containing protein [Telmatospirillum sp.]|nr:DUF3800 domain-containing protein [Telmatospirillum sp.]